MTTWLRILLMRHTHHQARQLALRAEASVRKLSNLPSERQGGTPDDVISILETTCLLLERLERRCEAPPLVAPPSSDPHAAPEPGLSATARELIKLRDWVLLAQGGDAKTSPQVLTGLYRGLGKVLEKEGVTPLEESGSYDGKRQQIVDTRPTRDPTQDNLVCATVRPGYLFRERLIRPQEVIVYSFDSSSAL